MQVQLGTAERNKIHFGISWDFLFFNWHKPIYVVFNFHWNYQDRSDRKKNTEWEYLVGHTLDGTLKSSINLTSQSVSQSIQNTDREREKEDERNFDCSNSQSLREFILDAVVAETTWPNILQFQCLEIARFVCSLETSIYGYFRL